MGYYEAMATSNLVNSVGTSSCFAYSIYLQDKRIEVIPNNNNNKALIYHTLSKFHLDKWVIVGLILVEGIVP